MRIIPKQKTAIRIMTWSIGFIFIFHVLVLLRIVPYAVVWGGRLTSDIEMYVFEFISIGMNLLLFMALRIIAEPEKTALPIRLVNGVLWLFLSIFVLNTIGNLLAQTAIEKAFALLTLAFASLLWIILRPSNKPPLV